MTWTTHQLRTDEMKANRSTASTICDGFEIGSMAARGQAALQDIGWTTLKRIVWALTDDTHANKSSSSKGSPMYIADSWLRRPANPFLLFFPSFRVCFGVSSRTRGFRLLSVGAKFARSRLTYPHADELEHPTRRHSEKSLLFIFTANIILACCVHLTALVSICSVLCALSLCSARLCCIRTRRWLLFYLCVGRFS